MPKIINAYSADANGSIANSLKELGESMFGNQAQQEVYRQTAAGKRRENENIPLLADALSRGDYVGATRYGVMSDRKPTDVAGYGQFYGVSKYGPASEQGTRATMAVPGANYAHTVLGERENIAARSRSASEATARAAATQLAIAAREQQSRDDQFNRTPEKVQGPDGNIILQPRSQAMGMPSGQNVELKNQRDINDMITRRQNEQLQWNDEHTLVNLQSPDGRIQMVPKSQVANLQAHGYRVMPTLENVKVDLFSPSGPTQNTDGTPAASRPNLTNLTPDQRTILGLNTAAQSYQHPGLHITGVSQDNGQTITLPDGRRIAVPGSGFIPVSHEAAAGQETANVIRNTAAQPLVAADPSQSAATSDARKASGLDAFVQRHVNTIGAIPGVIQAGQWLGVGPEIGPKYERARAAQAVRNQEARATLLATPGRQTVQGQKWVDDLLPKDHAIANPETEAGRVSAIVNALKFDHELVRKAIANPNTPPAELQKLLLHLRKIEDTIRLFTEPPQIEPQPQVAPAPGTRSRGVYAPPAQQPSSQGAVRRYNPQTDSIE